MKSALLIAALSASASALALYDSLYKEQTNYFDWLGYKIDKASDSRVMGCAPWKITLVSSLCFKIGEITGPAVYDLNDCGNYFSVSVHPYQDPADPDYDTKAHELTITDSRTNK